MPVISVNCFYKDTPVWETVSAINKITENNIDLWRINLQDQTSSFTYLFNLLNTAEAARFQRYHKEEDRNRFLVGRSVFKMLAGRYLDKDPLTVTVQETRNKKPFLPNEAGKELHYNLSHSGKWILMAIAGSELGIDIELVNPGFAIDEIMDSAFSPAEQEFIRNSTDPRRAFFLLWTRKESLLKSTGRGLVDDLSAVPSLEGLHEIGSNPEDDAGYPLQVCSFEPDKGYIGSVAYRKYIEEIHFLEFGATEML